jgi:ATPase subunit of ABC transporter with duplicated ATPase domains
MLDLDSVVVEKAGRVLFGPVTFTFGPHRHGLVGSSGVGKSSLARVMAGLELPKSGRAFCNVSVRYLPQSEARPKRTVDDFLADLWCSAAPSDPLWRRLLPDVPPDAPLEHVSGGEWMRLRLLCLLSSPGGFVILDEPTNHLDGAGRAAVAAFVENYRGGLVVISHDRELLRRVEEIVELTPKGLQRFAGAFDFYMKERTAARQRQEESLRTAERQRKKAEAQVRENLAAEEKRMRAGARKAASGGVPTIVAGGLKRQAQATHGRLKRTGTVRVGAAEEAVREAVAARQADPFLRLDFEAASPPAGAIHAEARALQVRFPGAAAGLFQSPLDFVMGGRERWRISGPNGSGKSTLLRVLNGETPGVVEGYLRRSRRPFVYLDQEQSSLPASSSILDALESSSRFHTAELRNELAFYGFTGERVLQPIHTMSGGERLRAALAMMFLGPEIPQVVLLDEPTNDLDFQSQDLLRGALSSFAGLLVVASHDDSFVGDLRVTNELPLEACAGKRGGY